jgi:hypothetical protein
LEGTKEDKKMNGYAPIYSQQTPQMNYQQIQQMFPQPQGSVYSINTPAEVGNVPIGSTGLSVAICFQDQIMYIKSFQNGSPVLMAYRVTPYTKEEPVQKEQTPQNNPLEERLTRLETMLTNLTNEGGKFNGLL